MENSTRKIVILDSIKSEYIEQAIFILRDKRLCEGNAVYEAEKIVSEYLKKMEGGEEPRKKKQIPIGFLVGACAISGVMLTIILKFFV